MIRFNNDYCKGACKEVLAKLNENNNRAYEGYGNDTACKKAASMIKKRINAPKSDVHFMVGGTPANTILIAQALRPYESPICCDTGHINGHETGAVESRGYKIITVPNENGKLSAKQVEAVAEGYKNSTTPEHVTVPKLVYISFPTESGTIYSKKELTDIHDVCKKYGLYFYIDGARLAYGLAGVKNDVKIEDFPKLCDAFYIGGTKCGALFGEALVINNPKLKPHYRNMMKQNCGMLAKGFLYGLQFQALFEDDLYFKMGEGAVKKAQRLQKAFEEKGYELAVKSPTNQIFINMTDKQIAKLEKKFVFEEWSPKTNGKTTERFCISWATTDAEIDAVIAEL